MAMWHAAYRPSVKWDPDHPEAGEEIPGFRIVSDDDPECWIVETNRDLPPEVQEEFALIIAEALSQFL